MQPVGCVMQPSVFWFPVCILLRTVTCSLSRCSLQSDSAKAAESNDEVEEVKADQDEAGEVKSDGVGEGAQA